MHRIWTLSIGVLVALSLMLVAGCDLLDVKQKGFFNLKNGTDATLKILVSDNDQCIIGLHSEVATNTWRNYDLDDISAGAFLCVDGKPQHVETGKSYVFDGALKESEAP